MTQLFSLNDKTIYVVTELANLALLANDHLNQRLMLYAPKVTDQRCLNTFALKDCPILTTPYGLAVLRENQLFDRNLSDYRVKKYGSTISGTVPFCSTREPF